LQGLSSLLYFADWRNGPSGEAEAVFEPSGARKARALTGVGWSGIGSQSVMRISFRSDRQDAKLGPVQATHCADLLTARENLRCCNVRRCQENCDKLLHWLTTDRGAPWALYPAIKRSVVCASPVLRYPSPNRHRTKPGQAGGEQVPHGFGAVDIPGLC
jgi:hypothetical protein